jgi:hypothetical protein
VSKVGEALEEQENNNQEVPQSVDSLQEQPNHENLSSSKTDMIEAPAAEPHPRHITVIENQKESSFDFNLGISKPGKSTQASDTAGIVLQKSTGMVCGSDQGNVVVNACLPKTGVLAFSLSFQGPEALANANKPPKPSLEEVWPMHDQNQRFEKQQNVQNCLRQASSQPNFPTNQPTPNQLPSSAASTQRHYPSSAISYLHRPASTPNFNSVTGHQGFNSSVQESGPSTSGRDGWVPVRTVCIDLKSKQEKFEVFAKPGSAKEQVITSGRDVDQANRTVQHSTSYWDRAITAWQGFFRGSNNGQYQARIRRLSPHWGLC